MIKILRSLLFYGIMAVIAFGILSYSLADKMDKSIFGYRFYEVLSGSMEPVVKKGDMIIVRLVSPEEVIPGDIVTIAISEDGVTLTHRVVELYEEDGELQLLTKGDANQENDLPVPAANMIGKVEFRFPYLGMVIGMIRTNIVYIAFAAAVLWLIWRLIRILRKQDEQGGISDE